MSQPATSQGGHLKASVLARHGVVATASILLVLAIQAVRSAGRASASWNEPIGWASLVLMAAAIVIGPAAKLTPKARPLLALRRETGAWSGLLAAAHVAMVMHEWAGWQLAPLWSRFQGATFQLDPGLATGNLVGTIAVAYAILLAITSNDAAQARLGWRWKAIQRTATTLMLLSVLHVTYFLYLDRYPASQAGSIGFHRWTSPLSLLLIGLVLLVAILRTAAFWWPTGSNPPANATDKTPNDR